MAAELAAEGTLDVGWTIAQAKRFLEAGASLVMVESEGITENVTTWRTDVAAQIADALVLCRLARRVGHDRNANGRSGSMSP